MSPDRVYEFEPAACRTLEWLPLAVRYKLDGCGLKIGLEQWQALPLPERAALLRSPGGAEFLMRVLAAVPAARRLGKVARVGSFQDYLLETSKRWGAVAA